MQKKNPCKASNEHMKKIFKNHLCLHCNNLSYWDWYRCYKRCFRWYNYRITEVFINLKNNFYMLCCDTGLKKFFELLFNICEFIPKKPVRKCKYYVCTNRKYFWTGTTEMDGTVWNPEDNDPVKIGTRKLK